MPASFICAAFGVMVAMCAQIALVPALRARTKPSAPRVVSEEPPTPSVFPPPPPTRPLVQPDELLLRHVGTTLDDDMRCDDHIPPESLIHTVDGESAVTVHVRSRYKSKDSDSGLHSWSYDVEFTNEGPQAIQLLTRHWVFVDASGFAEEIKGPGARGATPVLKPKERFSYKSGARLLTERGSMHGWFSFEELSSGKLFLVRVGRLALSPDGTSELVPCKGPAVDALPVTSVHSTDRVIVGAVAEVANADADLRQYTFALDLQINNARSESVSIVGPVLWEIIDGNGVAHNSRADLQHAVKLEAGHSLRMRSMLPQLGTPVARVSGTVLARLGGDPSDRRADLNEASPYEDEVGLAAEEEDDEAPLKQIVIAPLGCSVDGKPVDQIERLGFLNPS